MKEKFGPKAIKRILKIDLTPKEALETARHIRRTRTKIIPGEPDDNLLLDVAEAASRSSYPYSKR